VNEGDLASDEATHQHLLGFGDGSQDREYAFAIRVCPPTTLDWVASNCFDQIGDASLRRDEDYAVISDESERLFRVRA